MRQPMISRWIALPMLALSLTLTGCMGLPEGAELLNLTEAYELGVGTLTPTPTVTTTPTPVPQATAIAAPAGFTGEAVLMRAAPGVNRLALMTADGRLLLFRDGAWLNAQVEGVVTALAWAPDADTLLAGTSDGRLLELGGVTGAAERTFVVHAAAVTAIVYSPGGDVYATAGADGLVTAWDVATNARLIAPTVAGASVNALAWSADGTTLAGGATFGNGLGAVTTWDLATGEELRGVLLNAGVESMDWRAGGDVIAAALANDSLVTVGGESGFLRTVIAPPVSAQPAATVTPTPELTPTPTATLDPAATPTADEAGGLLLDDQTTITPQLDWTPEGVLTRLDVDGGVHLYSLEAGLDLHYLEGPYVSFDWRDGALILLRADGSLEGWVLPLDAAIELAASAPPVPTPFAVSEALGLAGLNLEALDIRVDGAVVSAGGANDRSIVWDLNESTTAAIVFGPGLNTSAFAYSPEGDLVASVAPNNTIRLWDASGATNPSQVIAALDGHGATLSALAWSPDTAYLASGTPSGEVIVWDIVTGDAVLGPLAPFDGDSIVRLAFNPGSDQLAVGGIGGNAAVYSVPGGDVTTIPGLTGPVAGLGWTTYDGIEWLAAGDESGQVTLFNIADLTNTLSVNAGTGAVTALAFNPADTTLAVADDSGAVWLWAPFYDELRGRLTAAGTFATVLAFNADGSRLAAGGVSGAVTVWDLE